MPRGSSAGASESIKLNEQALQGLTSRSQLLPLPGPNLEILMAAPKVVKRDVCLLCGRKSPKLFCQICMRKLEADARHAHNTEEHSDRHSRL